MKKACLLLLAVTTWVHAAAEVGKPAPAFTLPSCESKPVSLSDFKGKVVVLEWTNHSCPFVVKHYGSGNMQKLQADAAAKGVVWLSICSSAPGKQGHATPADAMKACAEKDSAATAYLIDESGDTGRAYGAKRTPEMFIIGKDGKVAYHGAIDDDSKTEKPGSTNYVAKALDELLAGQTVTKAETQPYGCSVKY
jgi:peroxiredoxin